MITVLRPSEVIEHYGLRNAIITNFGWCITVVIGVVKVYEKWRFENDVFFPELHNKCLFILFPVR